MEAEILQSFKGKINGVEFDDEKIFRAVECLGQKIEDKFGKFSDTFIEDLRNSIGEASRKYDTFAFDEFENSVIQNINYSNSIKEFTIDYNGFDWKFEKINENLKNGNYFTLTKENENNQWSKEDNLDKTNAWSEKVNNDKASDLER